MKIVFIHAGPELSADSLSLGPLGGTETALIGMARALANDPRNEVLIFTNTAKPGRFDGVTYGTLAGFGPWAAGNACDVLISIRQWIPFILPVRARMRVYFSPDAHDQPFLHRAFDAGVTHDGASFSVPCFSPASFLPNVDAVFCVGAWQAGTFSDKLGFPRDKIFVTGNGVFLENFAPQPLERRVPRLIYSSTPFRGLDHLLRYFPAIKSVCPAAELDVFSGMGVYGLARDEDEKLYGALYRRIATVGAVSHGSVRQDGLARALCAARVFAYPNTFEETFCIAVLEAQAAGLPVVTSKKAALAERVTHEVDGFLIDGDPGDPSYDGAFLSAVCRLLQDDALWNRMSAAARAKAFGFTYGKLAGDWMESFRANPRFLPQAALPRPFPEEAFAPLEVASAADPNRKIRVGADVLRSLLGQAHGAYGFSWPCP